MGTSLPIYVRTTPFEVTLTASEAGTATQILDADGKGCAGVLFRGVIGQIDSAGGKVTINIYSEATVADAIQQYSVELDHTTLATTSDTQEPGIPVLVDPYITITGDSTANTKDYICMVYLQKIAVIGGLTPSD